MTVSLESPGTQGLAPAAPGAVHRYCTVRRCRQWQRSVGTGFYHGLVSAGQVDDGQAGIGEPMCSLKTGRRQCLKPLCSGARHGFKDFTSVLFLSGNVVAGL